MRKMENVMSRYLIAMFLLLLLGAAVEELADRSATGPDATGAALEAAQ
jgi:hypothetical protein